MRRRRRGRSGPLTRRRLLLLAGTGLAGAGATRTGAFESVTGDRNTDVSVASDANALLGLSGFKQSKTYKEPQEVTVTNQTDSTLTDNRVRSDINGGNGDLQFRDVGGSNATTNKALGDLSPSDSGSFEIVTAPDESGEVTDTVTLEYASPGNVTITVVRDITVKFKAAGQLVYAVDTAQQTGDIRVYDAVNNVLNTPPQSVKADVIGANAADIVSGNNADIPFAAKGTKNKDVYATWIGASSDQGLGKGKKPKLKKQKTRFALRPWPPSKFSGPIVLAADNNSSSIVGIGSDGSTETIAKPGNGCGGVAGVKDIDGDGQQELVFVDSSQQIRYLEQDGTTTKVQNGGVGSNNSTGFGSPAVFPGSPTSSDLPEIPFIDGSNNVALVTYDGTKKRLAKGIAKKAAIAPVDIDGDGDLEFAFLGSSNGRIKYVDNIRGQTNSNDSNNVKTLQVNGSPVTPLEKVGLNSGT